MKKDPPEALLKAVGGDAMDRAWNKIKKTYTGFVCCQDTKQVLHVVMVGEIKYLVGKCIHCENFIYSGPHQCEQ